MSELVIISRDGSPYSIVCVKEESVFFNNLQSIFLIVLRREDQLFCKWESGARNLKLIQLQNRTYYIMDSVNSKNYT